MCVADRPRDLRGAHQALVDPGRGRMTHVMFKVLPCSEFPSLVLVGIIAKPTIVIVIGGTAMCFGTGNVRGYAPLVALLHDPACSVQRKSPRERSSITGAMIQEVEREALRTSSGVAGKVRDRLLREGQSDERSAREASSPQEGEELQPHEGERP